MKNFLLKAKNYLAVGIGVITSFVVGKSVSATTDPLLVDSMAQATSMITDNRGAILTFIIGTFILLFVVLMGKRAVFWAGSMFGSIFKRR